MKKHYIALTILTAIVIGAIIYAFSAVGTPAGERASKFDERRLDDFSILKQRIQVYYNLNKKLPSSMEDLYKAGLDTYAYLDGYGEGRTGRIRDPETDQQYGYEAISENTYKLCATFSTATWDGVGVGGRSQHRQGYDCKTNSVSPPREAFVCTSTFSGGGIIYAFDLIAKLENTTSSGQKRVKLEWDSGAVTDGAYIGTFNLEKTNDCKNFVSINAPEPRQDEGKYIGEYTDSTNVRGRSCYRLKGTDRGAVVRGSNLACVDLP